MEKFGQMVDGNIHCPSHIYPENERHAAFPRMDDFLPLAVSTSNVLCRFNNEHRDRMVATAF